MSKVNVSAESVYDLQKKMWEQIPPGNKMSIVNEQSPVYRAVKNIENLLEVSHEESILTPFVDNTIPTVEETEVGDNDVPEVENDNADVENDVPEAEPTEENKEVN